MKRAKSWSGAVRPIGYPLQRHLSYSRWPQRRSGPPLSYAPPYLTEKILDARPRLEGERKQATALFADSKDSTELIEGALRQD
jgi:hypothetical protein